MITKDELVRDGLPYFHHNPNSLQQNRLKPLTSKDRFRTKKKDAVRYILAMKQERMLYFYDCQNIDFQDTNGQSIWPITGEGEMKLPGGVGVYIVWGFSDVVDL
jgi:hypothetical protein